MISGIVAMAHDNVIGSKNDLPWYLPADLKRFRVLTTGHPVIMGRKTYESIVARLGHGLPKRTNIVITRGSGYDAPGAVVVNSLEEALEKAGGEDAFVIGGEQIFRLAFPVMDRLYVTEVDADIPGDTFFPELKTEEWQELERELHARDDRNPYDYSFVTLTRR